jgi:hypothetical protein
MSKLQKKPSALKIGHPTLQNMNFFIIKRDDSTLRVHLNTVRGGGGGVGTVLLLKLSNIFIHFSLLKSRMFCRIRIKILFFLNSGSTELHLVHCRRCTSLAWCRWVSWSSSPSPSSSPPPARMPEFSGITLTFFSTFIVFSFPGKTPFPRKVFLSSVNI